MSIVAVGDSLLLASQRDAQALQDRPKVSDQSTRARDWEKQNQEELDSLREQSKQHGMEVRIHAMAQSNQIVIRFVEPTTGQVIREFPSEDLACSLRELQQNLTLKNNELPLVDQRA